MANRKQKGQRSPKEENSPHLLPAVRRRRQIAFESIAEAKRLLDPNFWEWHSSTDEQKQWEIDLARDFLKDIEKEARRTGGKRGNKPGAAQNERMITVLDLLAVGGSLKEFSKRETRAKDTTPEDHFRAIKAQIPKWCRRVYDAMIDEFGPFRQSAIRTATNAMIRSAFEDWPGLKFPRDLRALRYAIQYHSGNSIPK